MAIEKSKLYERTRRRWPSAFRVIPAHGVPGFESEPNLLEVYQAIEAGCQPAGERAAEDEWTGLANWSFHQALWGLAKESVCERDIRREEVTFEMFDTRMRDNLSLDCWAAERGDYDDSPSRFH